MKVYFITPVKNEEKSIDSLIESIAKQDRLPDYWLFIDNYSDDNTVKVITENISNIKYEIISHGSENKNRSTGGNVAQLINYGINYLSEKFQLRNEDLIIKIDADIVVDHKDYISFFREKFLSNSRLGIASGATYIMDGDEKIIESRNRWHTQGPNKFYRYKCLVDIGYLKEFKGWDGIDNIIARERGYITEKYFEQTVFHSFPTQTRESEGGWKAGVERELKGYRYRGYPYIFIILLFFKMILKKNIVTAIYFLKMSTIIYSNEPVLVTKKEQKMVKRFLLKRITNSIEYSS